MAGEPAIALLHGLRVLETGTGVAAPYAGRLLAMLGATVVKVEPNGGDPSREVPNDDAPLRGTSPLFLHLNAGKRNVPWDEAVLNRALDWADVVLESRVRDQLRGTLLDPARLAVRRRTPLLAAVTAWGFAAGDPGRIEDELLVQAASGFMTITGDPERASLHCPAGSRSTWPVPIPRRACWRRCPLRRTLPCWMSPGWPA